MMNRKALLLNTWLAISGVACGGPNAPSLENPDLLLEDVHMRGAATVIRSLWDDRAKWEAVMDKIASGNSAWINVALALRTGSDAGSTSELHSAMFLALGNNPAYVLSILQADEKPSQQGFLLTDVCEGRVDPPATYQDARAEIARIRLAVERVQEKDLEPKKEMCLKKLREGEERLKRVFGVTE